MRSLGKWEVLRGWALRKNSVSRDGVGWEERNVQSVLRVGTLLARSGVFSAQGAEVTMIRDDYVTASCLEMEEDDM